MADFGQTDFGQTDFGQPTLAKPTLTCGVVCLCACVCVVPCVGFPVLVWSCLVPPDSTSRGPPFPRTALPGTAHAHI